MGTFYTSVNGNVVMGASHGVKGCGESFLLLILNLSYLAMI